MTNTTKPFPLRTPGGGQPPAKELPTVSQKQVSLCLSQSCAAAPAFWVEVTIYFLDPKPRPGFSIWPQSRPFECHAPWAVYKRALFFHPLIPRASMQMFLPGLERPPDSQAHVCAPTRLLSGLERKRAAPPEPTWKRVLCSATVPDFLFHVRGGVLFCVCFLGEKAPVESAHLRNSGLDQRPFQSVVTEFSWFLEPNALERKQPIGWELFCVLLLLSTLGGLQSSLCAGPWNLEHFRSGVLSQGHQRFGLWQ